MPLETDVEDGEYPYSDDVIAAVDGGRKIEAIKILREESGLGLRDAKHAIEALQRERRGNPAIPAGMSEEGGAGGLIKAVVAIVIVLGVYFYFFAG